jgi:ribosome-binding factor A
MATRRQEKVARVVKETVSDVVSHHLSDPRIEGFVSITRVEMATDLRNAYVYFSVFGMDQAGQNKTFAAIMHAKSKIQAMVAEEMHSKFCPVLHFYMDDKFKKTLETLKLIDKASGEHKKDRPDDEVPE